MVIIMKIYIKNVIERMCDIKIENDDDILYDSPYKLTALDIVYIICNIFEELGCSDIKIPSNLLAQTSFSSLNDLTQFIQKAVNKQQFC